MRCCEHWPAPIGVGRSAVVQRVLREALTPLGVRLSGAELHDLAASISAGKPVALP